MASLADLQAERERLKAANAKAEFDAALAETCAGADLMAWKRGGGQAVLLSCHYDVLDWDYTVAVNAKK